MTRQEHLLTILMEECAELAHVTAKVLRFGPGEVQPGHGYTNAERVGYEMADVLGVWRLLAEAGLVPHADAIDGGAVAEMKRGRVERFLEKSRACGTLSEGEVPG